MIEQDSDSPFIEEMVDEPSSPAAVPAASDQTSDASARYEAEVKFLLFRLEKTESAFAEFKTWTGRLLIALLLLFCVSGILIFLMASRMEKQIADLKSALAVNIKNKFSAISFSHWEQGEPPVQLIKSSEGLCVLTKVTGHFQGGGESVRLYIENGYWYLGGESHQRDVAADCAVLRY